MNPLEYFTITSFFILGVGVLFPWNAIITRSDYFHDRLFDAVDYQRVFESSFTSAFNFSNLLALCAVYYFHRAISESALIVVPFGSIGIVLFAMSCMTLYPEIVGNVFFYSTLCLVSICGACTALVMMEVTAFSGHFSLASTAAYSTGQAFAGLITSIVNIVTTAVSTDDRSYCNETKLESRIDETSEQADWATFAYFFIASATCCCCILLYAQLARINHSKTTIFERLPDEQVESTLQNVNNDENEIFTSNISDHLEPNAQWPTGSEAQPYEALEDNHEALNTPRNNQAQDLSILRNGPNNVNRRISLSVLQNIWKPSLTVFMTFIVTLAVFPSIVAEVRSVKRCSPGSSRFWNDMFVPFLFIVFNAFDLVSRAVQRFIWAPSNNEMLALSFLRVVFIPLFSLLRIRNSRFLGILDTDFFAIMLCSVLGFSTGFLFTASLTRVAEVQSTAERQQSSKVYTIFSCLGLLLGSMISFSVLAIIRTVENPDKALSMYSST